MTRSTIVTSEELIPSQTAAAVYDLRLPAWSSVNIFLIDASNIGSDSIPFKLLEPGEVLGAQYKNNGISYQLDSSNYSFLIQGPTILRIDKPTTTSSVGVGVYKDVYAA